MDTAYIQTPLGTARLTGDADGLVSVSVLEEEMLQAEPVPESLEDACYQLQEYFEGSRTVFDLTLNPEGTEFQKKVWAALCEVPYGNTLSYLELSKKLGDVKAIRAVAAANGQKPYMDHRSLPSYYWQRWIINGLCWGVAPQTMVAGARKPL
jgi:methylated-DNA-[protein]-cysteine S-methyltransferase